MCISGYLFPQLSFFLESSVSGMMDMGNPRNNAFRGVRAVNRCPLFFLVLLSFIVLVGGIEPANADDTVIIFKGARPYVSTEDTLKPPDYDPKDFIPLLYPLVALKEGIGKEVFFTIKTPASMVDITNLMNDSAGTCYTMDEDRDYQFGTNIDDIMKEKDNILKGWKIVFKRELQSVAGLQNLASALDVDSAVFSKFDLTEIEWTVTDTELSTDPASKSAIEILKGTGKEPIFNFKVPTDPFPSLAIYARAYFSWEIKIPIVGPSGSVASFILGNEREFMPDLIRVNVLDRTPPIIMTFTPSVLFGTSGDHIVDFNARRNLRNIAEIPENESNVKMMVFDNARYGMLKGQGVLHDPNRIQCLFYFETFVTSITPDSSRIGGRQPSRIEKMTGEFYSGSSEPPQGIGQLIWVGPISLDEYYVKSGGGALKDLDSAVKPESIPGLIGTVDNEAHCVHKWNIPIADLEKALRERMYEQYKDKIDPTRRVTLLSHQFASTGKFQFFPDELFQTHWIDDVVYYSPNETTGKHLGGFEILRATAAVSDASGNWLLPETEMIGWDARKDLLPYYYRENVDGVISLKPFFDASENSQVVVQHRMVMPVVVFDNDKPNPMLLVTAKGADGSTRTTRFYIPNGDLADLENGGKDPKINPWVNDDQVWEFDAAGESPTMKFLKDHDRERYEEYMKALQIQENSRVVFETIGYDNVNKWVVREEPFSYFGIVTPIAFSAGVQDDSMIRPVTWKINDPTTAADPQLESLMYEDKQNNTYVYPDYVYRNVDETQEYGAEFTIHDGSNFNDPDRNGGIMNNWRTLRLKFKILKNNATWEGIEKLGSKEQVEHDSKKDQ